MTKVGLLNFHEARKDIAKAKSKRRISKHKHNHNNTKANMAKPSLVFVMCVLLMNIELAFANLRIDV